MEYKITGDAFNALEVTLSPGDTFYAEQGHIVCIDDGVEATSLVNRSGKGNKIAGFIKGVIKSASSGESVFLIKFVNGSQTDKKIILSGMYENIMELDFDGTIICGRGCYIASANILDMNFDPNTFINAKVKGTGIVFLESRGTPIIRELGKGEKMQVGENHVIALQGFNDDDIDVSHKSLGYVIVQSEDLTELTGPGTVYLSPLPFRDLDGKKK